MRLDRSGVQRRLDRPVGRKEVPREERPVGERPTERGARVQELCGREGTGALVVLGCCLPLPPTSPRTRSAASAGDCGVAGVRRDRGVPAPVRVLPWSHGVVGEVAVEVCGRGRQAVADGCQSRAREHGSGLTEPEEVLGRTEVVELDGSLRRQGAPQLKGHLRGRSRHGRISSRSSGEEEGVGARAARAVAPAAAAPTPVPAYCRAPASCLRTPGSRRRGCRRRPRP